MLIFLFNLKLHKKRLYLRDLDYLFLDIYFGPHKVCSLNRLNFQGLLDVECLQLLWTKQLNQQTKIEKKHKLWQNP